MFLQSIISMPFLLLFLLLFIFFETKSRCIPQEDFELMDSPCFGLLWAGITSVCHCAWYSLQSLLVLLSLGFWTFPWMKVNVDVYNLSLETITKLFCSKCFYIAFHFNNNPWDIVGKICLNILKLYLRTSEIKVLNNCHVGNQ